MTTVGRWSPNKVRKRVLDGTWVVPTEIISSVALVSPTSVDVTGAGSSATISSYGGVSFSSCATIALNGVFKSGYDNYQVVHRALGSSESSVINFRLRAGGTNTSGSDYTDQYIFASGTSLTGSRSAAGASPSILAYNTTYRSGMVIYLWGPYLAQPTAIATRAIDARTGNANIVDLSVFHSLSTAYDGFYFAVSAGTITGSLAVYGFKGS